MGGRWRVDHDRVDAAQGCRPLRDPQRIDERTAGRGTAIELDREHPSTAAELPRGNLVLGMRGAWRVPHPAHAGPALQQVREHRRRRLVAFHPERERGDAAQDEERAEGRQRAAGVHVERPDRVDQRAAPGDRTGQHVGVPGDVLRGGLHDEVGAQLEGPAQVGRGERVVHDERGAVPVGQRRQLREVRDHQRGIRDGLQVEDSRGRRGEGGLHGRVVRGIHERGRDAGAGKDRGEEAARRAVEGARRDDPIPGGHLRRHREMDRGHAGRGREARLGAVQRRERLRQRIDGRVAQPRVDVPRLPAGGHRAQLVRVGARERGGLVDRYRRGRLIHPRNPRGRPDRARREAVLHRRIVHRHGRPTASPAGLGALSPARPSVRASRCGHDRRRAARSG